MKRTFFVPVLIFLLFLSCWFGGGKKGLPENPQTVIYLGLVYEPEEISKKTSYSYQELNQKIYDNLQRQGTLRLFRANPMNRVLEVQDTAMFQLVENAEMIVQFRFIREYMEWDKSTLIPLLIQKPTVRYIWEFQLFLWKKHGRNFLYSAPVTGEFKITSHVDVIDFDQTDPSLYVSAVEKKMAAERSLENFAENANELIKRYLPSNGKEK